jgi:nucleoid-associated protein YgaU
MKTINVAGGNLYALAAEYLGDATQWTRIALQNGLTDPFLPNTAMTLVIPDVDETQTGGVPPQ